MFNANAIHNVLNWAIAISGAATTFLLLTGCTTTVTGGLECSASWLNPAITAGAITAMGVVKSLINIGRDGFGGLFKKQPPVV